MILGELSLHNLKCFNQLRLNFEPGTNLVYGKNGSGKTTILEALALLSRGRGVVSSNNRELIAFGSEALTAHLDFTNDGDHSAGFSLNKKGDRNLKLDGQSVQSLRPLAKLLPLLFVTPKSFLLLEGGAKERRRFLDWLVFHVEPDFANTHTQLSKTLLQRNALLKQRQQTISEWDKVFIKASEAANALREKTLKRLLPYSNTQLCNWLPDKQINIFSYPGWSSNSPLSEQLEYECAIDQKRGYTNKGAHRYDLQFVVDNHKASQVLSRGEKKRVVLALVFSQLEFACQLGLQPVLLIDDLGAELDLEGFENTISTATKLCRQLIVTTIEKPQARLKFSRVFHVKHGKVASETK